MRRFALTTLAAVLATTAALAQDSTLTRLIREYQLPLVQTGTQFSGAGWNKLQQDVTQSQFVVVGENHGTAQIPQFTAALAQVLQTKVFVGEISPYEAQDLTMLAAQPGAPTAYFRQHPSALSFYSWSEEFKLARQLQGQQVQLLGIDQENLFAPGRFYTRLAELSKGKATKAYLRRRAATIQAHDRAVLATDPGRSTLLHQSAGSLDSLAALTRQESPAVRAMVEAYRTSARIYQSASKPGQGMQSHLERIGLMKRNLLRQLRPYQPTGTEALPKMLLKFGFEHGGRGLSYQAAIYDVGNLVVNLADAQNQKSLHLLVIGHQGRFTSGFNPDDHSKNSQAYTPDTDSPLHLFHAQTTPGAWLVVDVRPLRRALIGHKLLIASPQLERVILGYDYVVVVPETSANAGF